MKPRRNLRMLGLALVAVFAFSAVAAANALAVPHFKASKTGELKGTQVEGESGEQVFTTPAGQVVCKKAATTGEVKVLEATEQEVTVNYSSCTAFGSSASITPAKYNIHANGEVDVKEQITITAGFGICTVKVPAQEHLKSVSFVNKKPRIEEVSNVGGIHSTGSGGICGGESTTGTYVGSNLIELVGGEIEWLKE